MSNTFKHSPTFHDTGSLRCIEFCIPALDIGAVLGAAEEIFQGPHSLRNLGFHIVYDAVT